MHSEELVATERLRFTDPGTISYHLTMDDPKTLRCRDGGAPPGEFGAVPHHLPGKNPDVNELTQRYNIPLEAVLGGGATLYPEYRKQLTGYTPPDKRTRYCCGWVALGGPGSAPGLTCISDGSGRPYEHPPAAPLASPLEPAR
ncbi:MAG: hypothetical protein FJW14_11465 [Acidimicrobiia bacterium]|nr:hypothetical protein [Acidimicrobiia bacterium]